MSPQTGSFISMDTYQGNVYDPASLHKYTYAQNNPEMYSDPSGHFIGGIGSSISTACSEILRNSKALHVMGMVSGMMNTIINQALGGEDDPGTAFIKGYLAGFGFGAVYYGALAIAAVYELTAIVHLGFFGYLQGISLYQLTLALSAAAVGNNKEALIYTALAVLCLSGAMRELGLSGVISVQGPKGTVGIAEKANKVSNSTKWDRNILYTAELDIKSFENLKDNGVIKVNTSGGDRPLVSSPNSYYRTANGEHVIVYDDQGKLIFDISIKRVKGFKINVSPSGKEFFQHFKLKGVVPEFIKKLFGW